MDNLILVNKENSLSKKYKPNNLVQIPIEYTDSLRYINKEVLDNFILMHNDAKKNKLNIKIASAYRDYSYQKKLYNNYIKEKGYEYANMCSAKPGHSEHQTGLALDLMSNNLDYNKFGKTKEYKWIKKNAYKYGFILRYPKYKENITGYKYEPWHIRYVGLNNSKKIYKQKLTLEEYLKNR